MYKQQYNNTEENHSEYKSRVQKLRIKSVASRAVHEMERYAEDTFREADFTHKCIWMYHIMLPCV